MFEEVELDAELEVETIELLELATEVEDEELDTEDEELLLDEEVVGVVVEDLLVAT